MRHGEHVAIRHALPPARLRPARRPPQAPPRPRRSRRSRSPPISPVPTAASSSAGSSASARAASRSSSLPSRRSSRSSTTRPKPRTRSYISLEIYNNNVAASLLATQIAAGNAPDIIGPVGVEGLNIFRDQLLDLAPLITKSGFDTSKYDPALVDFFKMGEGGATIGVPFATYPSMLWYNTKAFNEAKLPLPPTKVGDAVRGQALGHGRGPRPWP